MSIGKAAESSRIRCRSSFESLPCLVAVKSAFPNSMCHSAGTTACSVTSASRKVSVDSLAPSGNSHAIAIEQSNTALDLKIIKWCSSFWKQRKARLPDCIRILSVRRNAAPFLNHLANGHAVQSILQCCLFNAFLCHFRLHFDPYSSMAEISNTIRTRRHSATTALGIESRIQVRESSKTWIAPI